MAILILVLSFLSSFAIICILSQQIRSSWLKTTVLYGAIITLLTEGLSLNQSLVFEPILGFWIGILVINGLLWLGLARKNRLFKVTFFYEKWIDMDHQEKRNKLLLGGILLILLINLVTALISPPNNWDSMTYHMSRVVNWIQNQSVAHYPTHIMRQISLPPGAAFLVMQAQILAGGDYFANAIQWLSYLGCIGATSLITNILFNPEYKYGLFAALVTASIPMAIMQSTTTQTDLTVAYWLICLMYFVLRTESYRWADIGWIGVSLSLAVLTKPTAYVFGLPLMGFFLLRLVGQAQPQARMKAVMLIALTILTLSLPLPYFLRNIELFQNPFGTDYETRNEIFGIVPILSNLTRLIAINLPYQFWSALDWLHDNVFQIDINDPRITHSDIDISGQQGALQYIAPHEDYVGSFLHLILLLFGLFLSVRDRFFSKPDSKKKIAFSLGIILVFGLLLFCIILRFQPWLNRLLLPLFVMATPLITYAVFASATALARKLAVALMLVMAIAYGLTTFRHPLVSLNPFFPPFSPSILTLPRQEIYFSASKRELRAPYHIATQLIGRSSCRSVGLAIGSNDWEYPLWVLLKKYGDVKIAHIDVTNPSKSAQTRLAEDELCAVITTPGAEKTEPRDSKVWFGFVVSEEPFVAVDFKRRLPKTQ
jgi:hypothetical protein